MVNLDSRENNVFDDTDRTLLECIRTQVPAAISMYTAFEKVIFNSEHDPLTGIYNRRYFENLYNIIQRKARRYQEEFHIVIFDLKDFKLINDRYGHSPGDALLQYFASEMSKWFRSSDIFFRFGGDEFIAIMFNMNDRQCELRFEEQRLMLEASPLVHEGNSLCCRFSYGIAHYGKDGSDYKALLSKADERMYAHKKSLKSSEC